jgi:hypothetical protein
VRSRGARKSIAAMSAAIGATVSAAENAPPWRGPQVFVLICAVAVCMRKRAVEAVDDQK